MLHTNGAFGTRHVQVHQPSGYENEVKKRRVCPSSDHFDGSTLITTQMNRRGLQDRCTRARKKLMFPSSSMISPSPTSGRYRAAYHDFQNQVMSFRAINSTKLVIMDEFFKTSQKKWYSYWYRSSKFFSTTSISYACLLIMQPKSRCSGKERFRHAWKKR